MEVSPAVIAEMLKQRGESQRKAFEDRIEASVNKFSRRLMQLETAARHPAASATPVIDVNFMTEIGAIMREHVAQQVGMVKTEVAALANRVRSLETQPQLKYMGVWEGGVDYARNSLVTHEGGLWIAKSATGACPGAVHDQGRTWQLCVKKGKDGKSWRDEKGWPTP